MALIFAEGFSDYASTAEMYRARNCISNLTPATLNTTAGNWSNGALIGPSLSSGSWFAFDKNPTNSTFRFAFWLKTSSGSGTYSNTAHRPIVEFRDSAQNSTRYLNLRLTGTAPNAFLVVCRYDDASNAAAAATGTAALGDTNWHHIEVEYTVNAATGTIKTWVDGVADINFTGDTTDAASGDVTDFRGMYLAGCSSNTGGVTVHMDDFLVWDDASGFSGRLSDQHRIRTLVPTANGDTNNFTPSAGSNYQNVDDATSDDDTTYNSSTVNGDIDLYQVAMNFNPQVIYAVQAEVVTRKTDLRAITARTKLKKGSSTQNGTTSDVYNGVITPARILQDKDPTDSTTWTRSKIHNQVQIGIERMS